MANSITRAKILTIYKQLLRESQKIGSYNFRNYAVRRIRDAFKENKEFRNPIDVRLQFQYANENLEVIRRQVIIGQLYSTDKLIIETTKSASKLH